MHFFIIFHILLNLFFSSQGLCYYHQFLRFTLILTQSLAIPRYCTLYLVLLKALDKSHQLYFYYNPPPPIIFSNGRSNVILDSFRSKPIASVPRPAGSVRLQAFNHYGLSNSK